MTNKFLGKLVVGAALGGAALLVSAPGIALADEGPAPAPHKNRIYTEPAVTHAGEHIKIIEVCTEPQEHPKAWSKVTGPVKLHLVRPGEEAGAAPAPSHKGGRPGEESGQEHRGGKPGEESGQEHKGGKGGSDTGGEEWKKHKVFVYEGAAQVDRHAHPGTYELKGSCAVGEIVVAPRGPVDGGDGGSATNTGMAAGGAGLVVAAALGSMLVLRRRQANGTLA